MKINVGTVDRVIRIVIGLALLIALFWLQGPWAWVAAIVGLILLATGLASRCPFYAVTGMNTRPTEELPQGR